MFRNCNNEVNDAVLTLVSAERVRMAVLERNRLFYARFLRLVDLTVDAFFSDQHVKTIFSRSKATFVISLVKTL